MTRRAIVAGFVLLSAAGCGGKAGDDDVQVLPGPGVLRPERPRPSYTPPAYSPAPTQGEPGPPVAAPDVEVNLPLSEVYRDARRSVNVLLETYCGACHGKLVPDAPCGLKFDDSDDLVATGVLVPLNPSSSRVLQAILEGSMPPPGVQPRPNASELDQLYAFIDRADFWTTLPPDGHDTAQSYIDAGNNVCLDEPDRAVDAGVAPAVDAGAAPEAG